ncbi:MAG: TerB family tellurite resistance protein [Burkholderiales bacterium]|jgi:uncharacterized tellurite resistance protein B-like protein|nr:TerB family tellurite resistance protein [Burkholderiales bacterium]
MDDRERALLKGLVQMIWADGEVSEEERLMLGGILSELGVSAAEIEEVGRMMIDPPTLDDLREKVPDEESRREILKLLVAMSMADGRVDTTEIRFLDRLAEHLEISSEEMDALREEATQVMKWES